MSLHPGESSFKTVDILKYLQWDADGVWGRVPGHGREIDAALLAQILQPYEIRPVDIRFHDGVRKGYPAADFQDGFRRYLLDESAATVEPA
jgi:hypothetical protein